MKASRLGLRPRTLRRRDITERMAWGRRRAGQREGKRDKGIIAVGSSWKVGRGLREMLGGRESR